MILTALLCGVAVGLLLGAVGGGGSLLVVPVFVYVFGQPVETAVGGSLLVVLVAAAVGAARAGACGTVCWRLVLAFAPTVLLGSALGALVGQRVPGDVIVLGLVPLLFAAAASIWLRAPTTPGHRDPGCPPPRPRVAAVGLAIGALTGFFGVGGGFVFVPVLILLIGLGPRSAAATSLAVICIAAAAGLAAHLAAGGAVAAGPSAQVAAAAAAGAFAGAGWGSRVSQTLLGRAFAAVATLVGLALAVDVMLVGGPPN